MIENMMCTVKAHCRLFSEAHLRVCICLVNPQWVFYEQTQYAYFLELLGVVFHLILSYNERFNRAIVSYVNSQAMAPGL